MHLPPGDYVSGTLRLRDHLVLRLAAGATLIASTDDTAFDPHEKLAYESFADRETTDFSFALLQGRGLQDVTHRWAGPDRRQPALARRPQADRAQAMSRRHDP